jgi:hypothetical protein
VQLAPARARGRSAAGRRAAATPRAAQGKGKGKGAAPATQRYTAGSVDIEMPLAAVQQLPLPLQAAVVAGIFAGIGLGTYVSCTAVAPGIEQAAPSFMAFSRATWPLLGATFVAAGVAHFTAHDAFVTMMPTRCAPAQLAPGVLGEPDALRCTRPPAAPGACGTCRARRPST